MDGSLQADGKTIASYEYNVDVARKVVDMAHVIGVLWKVNWLPGSVWKPCAATKEDGHGTDATMTREQLLTDPNQAAGFS